jgi:hypothetical protein
MNFENKGQPMASPWRFTHRLLLHLLVSASIVIFALAVGVLGYHFIARFTWVDALLDASMILAGMGPVGTLTSDGAKVFASAYALFSGLVFIGITAILFAPVVHRVLHAFHIDDDEAKPDPSV